MPVPADRGAVAWRGRDIGERKKDEMANSEGLSIAYRLGWNIRRIAMMFLGPAQLGDQDDPTQRLHAERRRKSAEALARRESGKR